MKIASLYGRGKTVFSFEIFPPKPTSPIESIYGVLEELCVLKPDYISVTYGAGGNARDNKTSEIASRIKNKYGIEAMAHLTCVGNDRDDILVQQEDFKKKGIDNILALRGDIKPDIPVKEDFKYASDLVTFIKENGDFGISGACYPECHLEAKSIVEDIANLKTKVDCGVQSLITQLFFDNSLFYDFYEKVQIAGIKAPICAGIMPVTNKKQIERMVTMCGASLPQKFVKMLQRYEGRPEALVDAGIAYAVDQIVDLISNGVDGIHIYAMNNPYVVRKISDSVRTLL